MKLLHIIWDVDMRCSHDGLTAIASKKNKALANLKIGEMVCFVNHSKNRVKILAGSEVGYPVLGYYRARSGSIDIQAIQYIPQAFRGGKIDYSGALKKSLLKRLPVKRVPSKPTTRHSSPPILQTMH